MLKSISFSDKASHEALIPAKSLVPRYQRQGPGEAAPLLSARIKTVQPSQWTTTDLVMRQSVSDFRISPDCRWLVWTRRDPVMEKGEGVDHLVLSSLVDGRQIQLTRGMKRCSDPKWSPDGKLIAFCKEEKGKGDKSESRLWLVNPAGGSPWCLTAWWAREVTHYEWLDSDTLLLSAKVGPSRYEKQLKEQKDDTVVVDDQRHAASVRLFRVSVKTGETTRLTENRDCIAWFSVSPDGRYAVAQHDRSPSYAYDQRAKPVFQLYDLKTGMKKEVLSDPELHVKDVRWARDGKGFYAVSLFTNHPQYALAGVLKVYYHDMATGKTSLVNLGWNKGLLADGDANVFEPADNGFIALLADGARSKAARYTRDGSTWRREWLTGAHDDHIFGLRLGKDNQTVVYEHSTASKPEQLYMSKLDQNGRMDFPEQLTRLNKNFEEKTIAPTEVIRWKGALNEEVEGILYYPHHYEPGKKYPLVVMIHGGPYDDSDLDEWDERWHGAANLMNQRGAFVLKVNYHGSSNYGLKWAESISGGKYYDLEVTDIEKGVDHLIARGLVDPEKLGVEGWSNGGVLTSKLTTTTNRYKAASSGAGDVEWASDWGNCSFGAAFDNYYFGKSPLEDPQLYLKKSPFYQLGHVNTPTIIFFGDKDTSVPTEQGWMHYRALQQSGKTPVRFVLFPDEEHMLKKLAHQKRKLDEELAWFDRYLFHQ